MGIPKKELKTLKIKSIEKPLEMPNWNLLVIGEVQLIDKSCLFFFIFSVPRNKITQPYAKQFSWLLVNKNKMVNKLLRVHQT